MEINPILVKEYGQQDPNFETKDYILSRESGEDVGNYKMTVKSKNKNYKYVLGEQSVFRILDKKDLEVKAVHEEKKVDIVNEDVETSLENKSEENGKTDLKIKSSKVCTGLDISLSGFILSTVLTGCMFIVLINRSKS